MNADVCRPEGATAGYVRADVIPLDGDGRRGAKAAERHVIETVCGNDVSHLGRGTAYQRTVTRNNTTTRVT